ncbi:hypothetical protein A2U01_0098553, partial [Trifolium medium]|nr:hypothetical protein [Trifolium medium]
MFADSIRNFKKYYVVRPVTPPTRDNLLELIPDTDEHGVVRRD